MAHPESELPALALTELRIGHFVHLNLSWMAHPFATNRFKITSRQQIDALRSLGLTRVHYDPARSDAPDASLSDAPSPSPPSADAAGQLAAAPDPRPAPAASPVLPCERQYTESSRVLKAAFEQTRAAPEAAALAGMQLVQGMLTQMAAQQECALRLLTETVGERSVQHALNVSVLALLLGRALGMPDASLQALGVAALWHDIGKIELPYQVRMRDEGLSPSHLKLYQEHVKHSVATGQRLGLGAEALLAIAQHHELADGSGFPLGLMGNKMTPQAQALALVNRYDSLCNPANTVKAATPHEALALIFATQKAQFEARTLSAFIRMMGIYPPGSVVQLNDERYAVVLSVNATRPLRPKLNVYDPRSSSGLPLLLDLQQETLVQIMRSLRPDQLPRPVLTQLSPRPRVCYYFERATPAPSCAEGGA